MSNQRKTLMILALVAAAQSSGTAHAQQAPRSASQAQALKSKPIRIILLSAGEVANPVRLKDDEVQVVLSSAATPEQLARLFARARLTAAVGTHQVNGALVRISGPSTDAAPRPVTEKQRKYFEGLLTRLRAAELRSSAEHGQHRELALRPVLRGKKRT